jgi:carboxyl-terminal processing protease
MDPKIADEFEEDLTGTFEGIGAEIGIKNDILTVIAPLDGMPAQKAGLLAGDKIYAIDGEITADLTVDEAVSKIRGPKGTDVVLTISHNGFDMVEDITITRGVIKVSSVQTNRLDNGLFLIKISNFSDDTYSAFNTAVAEILRIDPKGIIIDLRNNPGGYLDTAIELASEWVEEGVIVRERFSEEEVNDYLARGRARLKDYPTTVLVNGGSASASEILAGALRDYGQATIVGEKTFGKGSVQTLEEFADGSSLKITVAEWLTPSGDCINEIGIEPNIEVDLTIEDYNNDRDPQLDKAIEIMLNDK